MRDSVSEATPLHGMCKRCDCLASALDVMEMLVRHGADLESRDNHNNTPLGTACKSGNVEAFKKVVTVFVPFGFSSSIVTLRCLTCMNDLFFSVTVLGCHDHG